MNQIATLESTRNVRHPLGMATSETTGERDLLLAALRVASTRSKLVTVELDSIGISLRHKAVNCKQALEWAGEEGLLDWIPLGREVADG